MFDCGEGWIVNIFFIFLCGCVGWVFYVMIKVVVIGFILMVGVEWVVWGVCVNVVVLGYVDIGVFWYGVE